MVPNDGPPEEFLFETASLYQRSGFKSGELLREAFPGLGGSELRELLVDVVRGYVLPQLDQDVQVLQIPSVHNPVRATNVSGQSVTWTAEFGTGPALTPKVVRVSTADIYTAARKRKIAIPQEND
ncbi:MAG TPA: hypothetical protein VFU06_16675 [Longimicrobiales bacterium]|nr:hypothetical protein [Longimicrobiales bacterium]